MLGDAAEDDARTGVPAHGHCKRGLNWPQLGSATVAPLGAPASPDRLIKYCATCWRGPSSANASPAPPLALRIQRQP